MTANIHGRAYQIPFMYYKAGLTALDPTYNPTDPTWAILYLMISMAREHYNKCNFRGSTCPGTKGSTYPRLFSRILMALRLTHDHFFKRMPFHFNKVVFTLSIKCI